MTHAPALAAVHGAGPPRFPLNWAALGFILTIALQAAAAVWWASALQAQAEATNRRLAVLEEQTRSIVEMREALSRIDERTLSMQRERERASR